MRKENREDREKRITKIAHKVNRIIKAVGEDSFIKREEGLCEGVNIGGSILPSPLSVAKYYGIRVIYKKMNGEMPSYLRQDQMAIYVSDRYINDRGITSKLVAHELGHFFLDNCLLSAMNDDFLNDYLPDEVMKEYEANIFAIFLMPQIMGKDSWENSSPRILNRKIYKKLIKKDN